MTDDLVGRLWAFCEHHGFAAGSPPAVAAVWIEQHRRQPAFDPAGYGARVLAAMRDQSFRDVAPAIGVSPATLNRVTRGGMPDVPTLYAIDRWLLTRAALAPEAPHAD